MNIIEQLNWRYACKQFDPAKKIPAKDFDILLESLRLTPSSYGLQPWKFVVVENTEKRAELVAASWNQKQVENASHLIVLCAPTEINEDFIDAYVSDMAQTRGQNIEELAGYKKMMMSITNKTEEQKFQWAKNQIYIALGNLLTVCATLKIDSCPMEGFKPTAYDEILGLASLGLRSALVCPVGYRSENDTYKDSKKVRFALKDLVVRI